MNLEVAYSLRKIQRLSLWYFVIGNFILNSFPVFFNSLEKNETAISKIQEQLKKEKG